MGRVRNKGTAAEMQVRRILHREGFRFRLHRRDLPGSPDIVLPRYRSVVFVNGCFWHGHSCKRGRKPASNREFWEAKLDRNRQRDEDATTRLAALGWSVFVVWECQLAPDVARLIVALAQGSMQRSEAPHLT